MDEYLATRGHEGQSADLPAKFPRSWSRPPRLCSLGEGPHPRAPPRLDGDRHQTRSSAVRVYLTTVAAFT